MIRPRILLTILVAVLVCIQYLPVKNTHRTAEPSHLLSLPFHPLQEIQPIWTKEIRIQTPQRADHISPQPRVSFEPTDPPPRQRAERKKANCVYGSTICQQDGDKKNTIRILGECLVYLHSRRERGGAVRITCLGLYPGGIDLIS